MSNSIPIDAPNALATGSRHLAMGFALETHLNDPTRSLEARYMANLFGAPPTIDAALWHYFVLPRYACDLMARNAEMNQTESFMHRISSLDAELLMGEALPRAKPCRVIGLARMAREHVLSYFTECPGKEFSLAAKHGVISVYEALAILGVADELLTQTFAEMFSAGGRGFMSPFTAEPGGEWLVWQARAFLEAHTAVSAAGLLDGRAPGAMIVQEIGHAQRTRASANLRSVMRFDFFREIRDSTNDLILSDEWMTHYLAEFQTEVERLIDQIEKIPDYDWTFPRPDVSSSPARRIELDSGPPN